MISKVFGFWLF